MKTPIQILLTKNERDTIRALEKRLAAITAMQRQLATADKPESEKAARPDEP